MNRRPRMSVSLALVLAVAGIGFASAPASESTGTASVIVRAASWQQAVAAIEAVGGSVTHPLSIVDGAAGDIPTSSLGELEQQQGVLAVRPNEPVYLQSSNWRTGPADGHVVPRETGADVMWYRGFTGKGVRVALIDTGVASVPDLAGKVVAVPDPIDPDKTAACVAFSGERHCGDSYGHGTFIAGLIAGTGASSQGRYQGVAPGAEIVSVKIAGRDGSADVTKVLAAIQWVVSFREQLNIKVLNLSLGTNSPVTYRLDPLNFAVQRAWKSGIAVVVSASNRGPGSGTISKPGDDPLVITTGAIDDRGTWSYQDDRLPSFSGRGPTAADGLLKPDVVAPGAKVIGLRSPGSTIEQLVPGGGVDSNYRRGSGTSMSAGVVSGSIALILQENPTWTPDRIKFALMSTAKRVASNDRNAVGTGLIDSYFASHLAKPGLANQDVTVFSSGTGALDGSRGDVRVKSQCMDDFEKLTAPRRCDQVEGSETAQGMSFDSEQYRSGEWNGSSWYSSQWNSVLGSSWYGSSWYGSSWYGSSWYGSSWYGEEENDTRYGLPILGSSWYGAWE